MKNSWWVVSLVVGVGSVLLLLVVALLGLGSFGWGMMGPGMMGGGMMGAWGGLGWIGGIVLVGLGVLAAVLILRPPRSEGGNRGGGVAGPTPREILETRYARGEITREQFEQMKSDLGL